jgi:Uncharacterized conserved protein (COG2071)
VRDLVIASWEIDSESVRRAVPGGLDPLTVDGRFLVSLVAFRVTGGRLGKLPVPPFSQLNVRTYVSWKGEPAVLFLASRVTAGGLPGRLLGAPYRQARLRVRAGLVRAPGLGVSIRFRVDGESEPGALGRHDLGLFDDDGLRALRIRRGEAGWRMGELLEPARADLLLALGVSTSGDPDLLYAERTFFQAETPVPA